MTATAPAPSAPAVPAKISTAPSPNSAPPPAAAPETSGQSSDAPYSDISDVFIDMDSEHPDHKKKTETKPKDDPKPQDTPKNPADDLDEVAKGPSEKPKADATKPTDGDKPPVKIAEVRTAYESLKKKVKEEYEPKVRELETLRAKVQELEANPIRDSEATRTKLETIEKRNQELENHIRYVDFQKSSEYQEKYAKPAQNAWANALRDLKGLTMTVEDQKTGESVTREVTPADLQYLANLEPAVRRTEINRLFPEDKEEVKRHINQIRHLTDESETALEKAKADAENHSKTQTEQQQQSQAMREKAWRDSNTMLATKYPQWFARSEDDAEGNAVFDRGTALSDLLFDPKSLTADKIDMLPKVFKEAIAARKPFSPDQLVKLQAIVRNKAANHDRLIHSNKSLTARVAELEKSLKEYEESGPDGLTAGRVKAGATEMTAAEEFAALDRGGR